MRVRYWSAFWVGYLLGHVSLSPAWEGRDLSLRHTGEHPAEMLPMGVWLQLAEAERAEIVEQYVGQRPPTRFVSTKERCAAKAATNKRNAG